MGIRGDRIAAVGDLSTRDASARLAITGLTVTPGFIDTHTHDDSARLATPDMPFKVGQGVTTVVVGNCGISLAPLAPEGDLPRPLDLLGDRSGFRYPRLGDYLAALDDASPAVNAVCLVGHTTLRAGALDRLDRPTGA